MPSPQLYMLLTYVPTRENATSIITKLLDEKLIACANIAPTVESHYNWKNDRYAEPETPIWIKTAASHLEMAQNRLRELHPYETPAILSWPIHANPDYVTWAYSTISNLHA